MMLLQCPSRIISNLILLRVQLQSRAINSSLGKFGNESWVWELTAGETFAIPQTYSDQDNEGGGLSHYSVFNKGTTTTRVPDGGTSIALLGMALIGLGGARKVLGKP